MLEALWIALSSRFPQAYDESVHLGIIRLYSHQFTPFISHQPQTTYGLGELSRNPAYLYEYLMSFPYRIMQFYTKDFQALVIFLRVINIAIFVGSFVILKKLLGRIKISQALANVILLVTVLIPLIPYLAAQINYDSLLFLFTLASVYEAVVFIQALYKKQKFNIINFLLLVSFCCLASLSQYSFLPIFLALGIFVIGYLGYAYKKGILAIHHVHDGWRRVRTYNKLLLIVLVVVSLGLFIERYGYNVVAYHTPVPSCTDVLTRKDCSQYSIWARNNALAKQAHVVVSPSLLISYAKIWTHISDEGLFSIFDTQVHSPAPITLLVILCTGVGVLGILITLFYAKKIFSRDIIMWLFLAIIGCYLFILGIYNLTAYLDYGQPLGVQGRYLLPIIPLFLVLIGKGYAELLKGKPKLKILFVLIVVLIFSQGGGDITYIVETNHNWYWSNRTIVNSNKTARDFFKLFLIDKPKNYT